MSWERVATLVILVSGGLLMEIFGHDPHLAGALVGAAVGTVIPLSRPARTDDPPK